MKLTERWVLYVEYSTYVRNTGDDGGKTSPEEGGIRNGKGDNRPPPPDGHSRAASIWLFATLIMYVCTVATHNPT